jgi:hypothetical protein
MSKPHSKVSRRTFLLAATAGTAATAAAIVGQKASTPGAAQDKSSTDKSGGYQLTEHVRNYYRTAGI